MGHGSAPCLLCGYMILDTEDEGQPSWLSQFRLLYIFNGVVLVSGFGHYSGAHESSRGWVAPPDVSGRWDDEGYNSPEDHRIGVFRQPPLQGRWGVAFHDDCWRLLLNVVGGLAPSGVVRLFDLCRSFPIRGRNRLPNWGHFYGGLDPPNRDENLHVEVNGKFIRHSWLSVTQIAPLSPLRIPELNNIFSDEPEEEDEWEGSEYMSDDFDRMSDGSEVMRRSSEDSMRSEDMPRDSSFEYFSDFSGVPPCSPLRCLPPELVMKIAALLPTHDFLSLRLASRCFTALFHDQLFWATRFEPEQERGWVLTPAGRGTRVMDWRQLYRLTNPARRSKAMHNRERIWRLALYVKRLLAMPPLANSTSLVVSDDYRNATVTADVEKWDAADPYEASGHACFSLYRTEMRALPPSIDRISFFFNRIGKLQYVVGMRVVGTCGVVVEMGYMGQEITVAVSGRQLTGLYLALSRKGIRAVSCVLDGIGGAWIGSLSRTNRTMRLVSSGRLSAIAALLDGCRILGLCVMATQWPVPSVRNTALWDHGIPSPRLQLNDPAFGAMYKGSHAYQPFYRSMFGGERGDQLPYLTGIQITSIKAPCHIEFEFAPRHDRRVNSCMNLGSLAPAYHGTTAQTHFSIDGPGGERISGVDLHVGFRQNDHSGLFTTWGRSCHFKGESDEFFDEFGGDFDDEFDDIKVVRVMVPAGATITGFYCLLEGEYSIPTLPALGVISEMLG